MALTPDNGPRIFLNIKDGRFIQRILSEGQDPIIHKFKSVSGRLRSMYIKREGINYGPELHIHIADIHEEYLLQMRLDSGYARSFMKIAPNFTLTEPMTLTPNIRTKDGRTDYGMFVKQMGTTLKWYYTRSTPNGMPDIVPCQVERDGVMVDGWDGSAQVAFLAAAIEAQNHLIPEYVPDPTPSEDDLPY